CARMNYYSNYVFAYW
nr:immunoglobulin heavy chain junction region [Mus musculus]